MSGFVYIWFDKKHRKFYIGSHWGPEDDGYVCSSNNMRNNYNNRPQDFKRRIISRITSSREALLNEEQRWIDMIPRDQFGRKYYNISHHVKKAAWWVNEETRKQSREIMKNTWEAPRTEAQLEITKKAQLLGAKASPANKPGWIPKHRIGSKHSEETKAQMSQAAKGNTNGRGKKGKSYSHLQVRNNLLLDFLKDKDWVTSKEISLHTNLAIDNVFQGLNILFKENKISKKLLSRKAYWRVAYP